MSGENKDFSRLKYISKNLLNKVITSSKNAIDHTKHFVNQFEQTAKGKKDKIDEEYISPEDKIKPDEKKAVNAVENKEIFKSIFSIHSLKKTAGLAANVISDISAVISFFLFIFLTMSFIVGFSYLIKKGGGSIYLFFGFVFLIMFIISFVITITLKISSNVKFWIYQKYNSDLKLIAVKCNYLLKIGIDKSGKFADPVVFNSIITANLKDIKVLIGDVVKFSHFLLNPENDTHVLKRKILIESRLDNFNTGMMKALIVQYKKMEIFNSFLSSIQNEVKNNLKNIDGLIKSVNAADIDQFNIFFDNIRNFKNTIKSLEDNFNTGINLLTN